MFGGLTFLSLSPSSEAPTPLLALVALLGLPITLWVYKRKIIYMGYVPTDARKQVLTPDIIPTGLSCEEVVISGDRRIQLHGITVWRRSEPKHQQQPKTVLVYLQGNAGNPLMRLPVFERLLMGPPIPGPSEITPLDLTILAVAPRSYWKSTMRTPTEEGLLSDYRHILTYASKHFPTSSIILYGHSLGGAISVCLTAQLRAEDFPNIRGLILENPLASIPGMVKALYPQRWLPYHHLGVFAFDRWDAVSALQNNAASHTSLAMKLSSSMLLFISKNDELVPNVMGESLFEASQNMVTEQAAETPLRRKVVLRNSLHENAWKERAWLTEMRSPAYIDLVPAFKQVQGQHPSKIPGALLTTTNYDDTDGREGAPRRTSINAGAQKALLTDFQSFILAGEVTNPCFYG
ncbi:hypothetical protein BXZ70DRAFT_909937 [Cristinia sonorae]|uniref:Serine aminopeptidase S33 domain-containing protein n=1 Tax=Cristinia sonorae TaxID=1940300 RepID=A0A8K0XLL1_9AGAR|nr:hypothetical protein BXZ70DRAFT_909937 [Cristinia sonorae]